MEILIWLLATAAALFALDRLLLWIEAKGWIYWRRTKRRAGVSDAVLGVASIFDPAARTMMEARQERYLADEDAGDGGDPSKHPD